MTQAQKARAEGTPVFVDAVRAQADEIVARYPQPRSAVLPLLHLLQDEVGWVTRSGMREIGALVGITPAEVLGTASFYTMFKLEPIGDHLVSVCGGMTCMLLGAEEILDNLYRHLGVANLGTTADGAFTVEEMECAAACGGAPCLEIDYRFFEFVDPRDATGLVEDVRLRGLDIVHAERGSVTAPLPPVDAEDLAAGPSPQQPVRADDDEDGNG